jgi:hypothetical protein
MNITVIENEIEPSNFRTLEIVGQKYHRQGRNVFELDSAKTRFHGIEARYLNQLGRRKLENLIMMDHGKEQPLIRYI